MKKLIALLAIAGTLAADGGIGIVDFTSCVTNSKFGKKEQENLQNISKQMQGMMEQTETELKELSAKFDDAEYLDSLSPKAEEEMKQKFQTLNEDLERYRNQFYQVLQHAQYQLVQKVNTSAAKAAEQVAAARGLDYVLNREVCFYCKSDLDVTQDVVSEMDKAFDADAAKPKRLSDNDADLPEGIDLNAEAGR